MPYRGYDRRREPCLSWECVCGIVAARSSESAKIDPRIVTPWRLLVLVHVPSLPLQPNLRITIIPIREARRSTAVQPIMRLRHRGRRRRSLATSGGREKALKTQFRARPRRRAVAAARLAIVGLLLAPHVVKALSQEQAGRTGAVEDVKTTPSAPGEDIAPPPRPLLQHAMCLDQPFEQRAGSDVTPRQVVLRCQKLLVMDTQYDYEDPEVQYCSGVVQLWADHGMARRDECFVDFCYHQLCLLSLVFYALYFFRPDEINQDMSLCSQSFLPFVAAVALVHDMGAHIKSRKLSRESGTAVTIAGHEVAGEEAKALLEEFYLPEEEWSVMHVDIRDMLDSRKATCQRLRTRQLREQQAVYAQKFALGEAKKGAVLRVESEICSKDAVEGTAGATGITTDIGGSCDATFRGNATVSPLQAVMSSQRPLSVSEEDAARRMAHYEWVQWEGTNANPDATLRYRRPAASVRPQLKVGVLLGVSNADEVLKKYQPIVNLWRCYANYHQLEFLMPTDDYNLKAHFRAANWFRWYMADQFLEHYDWLILVDPDQYIQPECWGPDRFSFIYDILEKTNKHVVMRDIFPPQTLNNGLTMLRNSAQGRAFLNLLLDKISWIQTFQHDQGAFDETVLEVVGVVEKAFSAKNTTGATTSSSTSSSTPETGAADGVVTIGGRVARPLDSEVEPWFRGNDLRSFDPDFYDSICMPWLFPDANGAHQIAAYSMCWWQNLKEFAGPSGMRRSRIVEFIDPRYVDMNHVVGWRRLEEPALLYHFAGPGKNFDDILDNFGLERHVTADCRRVYDFVETKMQEKQCVPGNNAVEDIHRFCPPPLVVC